MSDIRTLGGAASYNGKLIYQLVSASALKDTDLFAISTSDNLTRKVSLSQIKGAINKDFYSNDEIDNLLDDLRSQIKTISDNFFVLENDFTEMKNQFNDQLSQIRYELNNTLNTKIGELNTSLTQKIDSVDVRLTNMIIDWIQYGTAIPTKLDPGRVYVQYF